MKEAAALQACTAELSQYGVAQVEVQELEQQDQLGRGSDQRGHLGANRSAAGHRLKEGVLQRQAMVTISAL